MNEYNECVKCEVDMEEIGGIGKTTQITDHKRNVIGMKEVILWQCPKCKKVVLD